MSDLDNGFLNYAACDIIYSWELIFSYFNIAFYQLGQNLFQSDPVKRIAGWLVSESARLID
jgi:hypothetical protein